MVRSNFVDHVQTFTGTGTGSTRAMSLCSDRSPSFQKLPNRFQ
jgi:hypothetical protein